MPNMKLLEAKVEESGIPIAEICRRANISRASYYNKTSMKREWKHSEMCKMKEVLSLSKSEFTQIFFD